MVATIVRMKNRMMWNSLMREKWKLVVAILLAIYLLPFFIFITATVTFVLETSQLPFFYYLFTLLSIFLPLSWMVMPMVGYGMDDSLDPRRFAPFITPTKQLARALAVATAVGPGGIITFLLLMLPVLASLGHENFLRAALYFVTGAVSLYLFVLMGRWSYTSLGSRISASQTGKDRTGLISSVLFILVVGPLGIWMQLLFNTATMEKLESIFSVAKWTPLTTPSALPLLLFERDWLPALVQIIYTIGLIVLFSHLWLGSIGPAMVGFPNPVSQKAQAAIAHGQWVVDQSKDSAQKSAQVRAAHRDVAKELPLVALWNKLGFSTATAAIAGRTLHDWLKDPRLSSSLVGVIFLPLFALAMKALAPDNQGMGSWFIMIAPMLLGMTVGVLVSYDSTAFWGHVSAGITGWQDRGGRLLGSAPVVAGLVVAIAAISTYADPSYNMAQHAMLLTAMFLISAGLTTSFTGRFTIGVQPPGANPLSTKGAGNQLVTFLLMLVVWVISGALMAPVALLGWFIPVAITNAWITPLAGLLWGALIFTLCLAVGAKVYDRGSVKLLTYIRSWPGH